MIEKHYIIIPFITAVIAFLGSWITGQGMAWYNNLKLPSFTPSGAIIGLAWTIIFILTTVSAIVFWNKASHNRRFQTVIALFLLNGLLNFFWSYLFFGLHLIGLAILEMVILEITVLALFLLIRPLSRLAADLLLPYVFWVAFATFLAYSVFSLNT